MSPFPYYEFFFALASYVLILVFAHFARQRPRLFEGTPQSLRLKIVVFALGSLITVIGGAWALAKLQNLENGLVFYGGLIGFLVFAAVYCRISHLNFVELLNRLSPALALAHAVGRIGCAIEGCCYGTRCDLPWAVHSPVTEEWIHPVQVYEALLLFALGAFLWKNESLRLRARARLGSAGIYLVAYAVIRFLLEFVRGDGTRGGLGPLSTSQWISLPLFVWGIGLIRSEITRGRVRR